MKKLFILICFVTGCAFAQLKGSKAIPEVKTVAIEDGAVTTVYLSPGYTTSIRLPEEVSSVVVGNPASFKAEHSESEPQLVFVKPIISKAAESNALITTKSGQEISLHLISDGQAPQPRVDFLLEYKRSQSAVIDSDANRTFFISETKPISPMGALPPIRKESSDPLLIALTQQQAISTPAWEGDGFEATLGESTESAHQTILRFSVFNNTKRTIELLPPQVELTGRASHGKKKQIKAEPIAITEYRISTRRLAPGERTDGVVAFERPAFKESHESLELELAEADQVDRPILLPIPFTATNVGGAQ